MTSPAVRFLSVDVRYSFALMQAALAARKRWLETGDRDEARSLFLHTRSCAERTGAPQVESILSGLIGDAQTTVTLLNSVNLISERFNDLFDYQADGIKFADHEIDDASDMLLPLLRNALGKIVGQAEIQTLLAPICI